MGCWKKWGVNARVLVLSELFWSLPFSWWFFYRPLFAKGLGLSNFEVGVLFSVPLVLQLFLPFLGGYLADRFGRKWVFMFFDAVGWTGALVLWLVGREFWVFLLAVVFEGLVSAIYGVWECLLVEDTPPEYRASVYGAVQLIYIVGSLLTPVAGLLVYSYGLVAGFRLLTLVALVSVLVMFSVRVVFLREPEVSERVARSDIAGVGGYFKALKVIVGDRVLLGAFLVGVVSGFVSPVAGIYWQLYLTDARGLGLDAAVVSVVPTASSLACIALLLAVVPRLRRERDFVAVISCSFILGAVGQLVLILAPRGSLALAVISALLYSGCFVSMFSVVRTFLNNVIERVYPEARAKILSLSTVLSGLFSWPAPVVAGYLFSVSPRLPFLLISLLLLASAAVLLLSSRRLQ